MRSPDTRQNDITEQAASDGGPLALLDWRRQVSGLYSSIRAETDPERAWQNWRDTRDRLFKTHAQSPLEPPDQRNFSGLPYFEYDSSLRFTVQVEPVTGPVFPVDTSDEIVLHMRCFGRTRGLSKPLGQELTLFWLSGYGGGLFLPFGDATNGVETYGGGRYLLDSIKGADLGSDSISGLILDFNFAYNPSCSYSPKYICPLSPPDNRLPLAVAAGERMESF